MEKKQWENENISAHIKYDFDEDKSLKYNYIHTESEYSYKNPFSTITVNGKPIFGEKVDIGNGLILSPSISSYLGYDGKKESDLHVLNYVDEANKFSANFGYLDMKKMDIVMQVGLKILIGMEKVLTHIIQEKHIILIFKKYGKISVNIIF